MRANISIETFLPHLLLSAPFSKKQHGNLSPCSARLHPSLFWLFPSHFVSCHCVGLGSEKCAEKVVRASFPLFCAYGSSSHCVVSLAKRGV